MLPNGKFFFFFGGGGEKRSESLQSSDLQKNVSIKDEEQTEYRFWNQRFLEPKVFKEFQVDRAPWATSARDGVSLALRALPRPRHFP